ncbi:DUF3265 domain-containing protein [Vibrio vulnificus]|nr:DUF3265 domain-containing protein [Vibrio vulnificus]EGQ9971698.1 DUF3265 domain-containing protein [Vibrio vulnificus]EIJ0943971.1 DUF3265 domain-containing protein [Vibrio vulnificus]
MTHNKALKRDSCRVAFLVCGNFCGESGLRKVGLGGTHPLTRRYNTESTSCSKGLVELLFVRYFVLMGVQYESYSFRSRYSAFI